MKIGTRVHAVDTPTDPRPVPPPPAPMPRQHTTPATEPRTEAGRRLAANQTGVFFVEDILAIEDEAAGLEVREARADLRSPRVAELEAALHILFMTGHEAEELREIALVKYGRHLDGCAYGPGVRCTCGWLEVLREIWPAERDRASLLDTPGRGADR